MKLPPSLAHFMWLCAPCQGAMPAARQSRYRGMSGISLRACVAGCDLEALL